jgi:hypothetical protein
MSIGFKVLIPTAFTFRTTETGKLQTMCSQTQMEESKCNSNFTKATGKPPMAKYGKFLSLTNMKISLSLQKKHKE